MDKSQELGTVKVSRLIFKYFVPAFVGVITSALYNIIDRIFIGQGMGAMALSGVSVVFPVMLIIMAFGMLIGIGSGVLVSINLGRRDLQKAERVLGNGFTLMLITSVFITIIGFLLKGPILRSFGATGEIVKYANQYLDIILLGTVFQVIGFSMNSVIRSEGNAKIAMYSMLLSAGTNAVLAPIFIFVFGWGVPGAAFATVLSVIILCIWVLMHFRGSRSILKLRVVNMKVDHKVLLEILAIGMAPFIMQIGASFVQGLLNTKLIAFGGDLAVAAMGIINSIATLILMSVVAINMASQPIIGFNYGAKSFHRVKETLRIALIASSAVSFIAFLFVQLFPHSIVKLFEAKNEELLALGSSGLRIALLALPVVGFQVVAGNFFQSVGKAKISVLLTLLRQVIVLIPLILILPSFFGLQGIWTAMPIADTCSALIVMFFLRAEWNRLEKQTLSVQPVQEAVLPEFL